MRRAAFLIAILLASSVSAAEANHQDTTWDAGATIEATSMAALENWFLMGTQDPVQEFPEDVEPSLAVWYLWEEADRVGRDPDWRQDRTGPADRDDCQSVAVAGTVTSTDCIGHVVALDLAWKSVGTDGVPYVLGLNDGDGEGYIQFYTSERGFVSEVSFAGHTVNDVAISGDGKFVAIGTTVHPDPGPFGGDPTGKLYLYPFNGATKTWDRGDDDTEPVTRVAIDVDDDGATARVLGTAGGSLMAYDFGGTGIEDNLGSNLDALEVAISHTPDQWGVAGFTDGHVNLYNADSSGTYGRKLNENPERHDITAVDITPDGRFYAAGDEAGNLFLYSNKFIDLNSPGLLEKVTFSAAVSDLAFSHNGHYLVAAGGTDVDFYRVTAGGLEAIWSDSRSATVSHVEVAGDGGTVLAAVGNKVHEYAPIVDLDIQGPADAISIEPEGSEKASITFHNKGNRDAAIDLSATFPTDWGVDFEPEALLVGPGQQESVELTVIAAADHPAGEEVVKVKAKVGRTETTIDVPIVVLQERIWRIVSNGTLNVGVDAGGSASLTVRVFNDGNDVDETTIVTAIDKEGWSASAQPATVRLEPSESTLVSIFVQAPSDAKELETATITVSPQAKPEVKVSLTATVGANFGLTFSGTLEGPLHPDERKSFELAVTNTGNAPDSVQIETEGLPKGWKITYPDGNDVYTVFSLQPGASSTIPVTVQVDDDAELANYQFRIRATSLGDTSQSQVVTITIAVEEAPVEKPKDNESPGLSAGLLVVGLLALALHRRFRP